MQFRDKDASVFEVFSRFHDKNLRPILYSIVQYKSLGGCLVGVGPFDFAPVDTIPRPARDQPRLLMLGTSFSSNIEKNHCCEGKQSKVSYLENYSINYIRLLICCNFVSIGIIKTPKLQKIEQNVYFIKFVAKLKAL